MVVVKTKGKKAHDEGKLDKDDDDGNDDEDDFGGTGYLLEDDTCCIKSPDFDTKSRFENKISTRKTVKEEYHAWNWGMNRCVDQEASGASMHASGVGL